MQKLDVVCRVAIFPKFVRDGVFDDEQFLQFQSLNSSKTIYATSVVSQYLMKSDWAIHKYGEMVASVSNKRLEEVHGDIVPEEKVSHYLGFYKLRFIDATSISMTYYSVTVKWRPESDCDAHFQIEMWQNRNDGTKRQRRNDRTAAVNQMVPALVGPVVRQAEPGSELERLTSLLPIRSPEKERAA